MSAAAMPEHLLAKSPRGTWTLSVEKHCHDTEEAAVCLFGDGTRWGAAWRRFFRLSADDAGRFLVNLRVAALFHDVGKANADFYKAVSAKGFHAQSVRHEHLSALVLQLPEVKAWLASNSALDHDVIAAAVLSHHCKSAEADQWEWAAAQGARVVRMYLQHPEVATILARIARVAGLGPAPTLPTAPWEATGVWGDALTTGRRAATRFRRSLPKGHSPRRGLLLAVKAGVIAADSAASGLVRELKAIDPWIAERAGAAALGPEEIREKIIAPRIRQVTELRRKTDPSFTFKDHRFQDGAATLGPRALVLAACGTGKTLAAWRWAEAQARARSIGKVVFLYPTRATATEGFRDYVSWAPEADASLMHGTATYELDAIQRNPGETPAAQGKDFRPSQEDDRLFALGFWSRRFFSATVDQFLGFMAHQYKGLCLLPALADSAVIVDEVHSFDQTMFESLVAFLEAFDVPVLCMTATLPKTRREALARAGMEVYPRDEHRADLADLATEEEAPRYRIERVAGENEARAVAVDAYRKGLRVLWVVNTVDRCQRLARSLASELGAAVPAYHSRFKLAHRQKKHAKVVEDFKQRTRAAIAVTTQVCEMSLDLDADVLITELAPVTSLVQRFGRSNRKRDGKPEDFRARVLVYEPDGVKPYDKPALAAARRFLDAVGEGDVSQARLALLLEAHAPKEPAPDGSAAFLDGGYYATTEDFRDIEEFTASAVLDEDLPALEPLVKAKQPWDGFVVPVPRREGELLGDDQRPAWLPRWVGLASSGKYTEDYGYEKGGSTQ